MDRRRARTSRFLALLFVITCSFFQGVFADDLDSSIYLVQLSPNRDGKDLPEKSHRGYLQAALQGDELEVGKCLIYCYQNVLDGFAATITEEQATKLQGMDGVLSVTRNRFGKLESTNSWKFLGVEDRHNPLTSALWKEANFGEDVIIGVIDSGIWPESASFNDEGVGPIPARWRGACIESDMFFKDSCNRKLIGAKFFLDGNPGVTNETWLFDYKSARDIEGHGTHVSSTAAGNFVAGANYNGYANGTAKGGAPRARIAAYKVCWTNAACSFADIVAAIDEALADGVDVITISISGLTDTPFYQDIVAIASFHAAQRGVLVNFAASNDGPLPGTVAHVEPWVLTVAASTQDRFLGADLRVGLQGKDSPALKLRGATSTNFSTIRAPLAISTESSKFCVNGTLVPEEVEGKIVFCLRGDITESHFEKALVVNASGGVGIIVGNADELLDFGLHTAPDFGFPGVLVTAADASRILAFMSAVVQDDKYDPKHLTAELFQGKTYKGTKHAPQIADFSSRGPNSVTADLLKPDISAPGVDILAAFADDLHPYVLMSGTSMAAPHVAGVAALLKAINPRWSPAAIKSAIMTSARVYDNTNRPIRDYDGSKASPLAMGSGVVHPAAAADPGLVYDASSRDYSLFLCALGYEDLDVEVVTGERDFCSSEKYFPAASDLNYPSISIANLTEKAVTVTRRVANVGKARSVYTVSFEAPAGVTVTIAPSILRFTSLYQTKSFRVKLQRTSAADHSQESYVFGSYTWSHGHYKVRSPIVIGTQPFNVTSL